MVSKEKISRKFTSLEQYLEVLREIAGTPVDDFTQNRVLIGSMRYYLQVSVESCLDVANHVIASERLRAPKDYADAFAVLKEENILPEDLSKKLMQMAKFRNRLVHLYGEIDDRKIHAIAKNDLGDIEQFQSIILKRFFNR